MRILFYLCILIIAVLIGLLIGVDPGYVLFSFAHWTVEMPLWLFIILFLLLLSICFIVFSASSFVRQWQFRLRYRKQWMRQVRAYQQLLKGLQLAGEANFHAAQKAITKSRALGESTVVHDLLLAYLAQKTGEITSRNEFLRQAYQAAGKEMLVVWFVQAQILLEANDLEQAIATLKQLESLKKKDGTVIILLYRALIKAEHYDAALDYLSELEKLAVLTHHEFEKEAEMLYLKLFSLYGHDAEKIKNLWHLLPKALLDNQSIILAYVDALYQNGLSDQALLMLQRQLDEKWCDVYADWYGRLVGRDLNQQRKQAERWQKKQENSAVLHLMLGRIAIHQQQWQEARSELFKSIQLEPLPAAYYELVKVLSHLGEKEQSLAIFREYDALQ